MKRAVALVGYWEALQDLWERYGEPNPDITLREVIYLEGECLGLRRMTKDNQKEPTD